MTKTRRRFLRDSALLTVSGALAAGGNAAVAKQPPGFKEYRQHDAVALAALVKNGDASATELLDIAIARTEQINPALNAVVTKHYELARDAIKQGVPTGEFSGVPWLLKDLGIALNGTVTTEGSEFFKNARHDYDSTLVARYKRAGLVIFGKTHSPEFGGTATSESQLFGDTHNPWNLSLSAGGSSGGSAAAVAAGIVPAAHASDGGGSIRIPASACGLFGMKPTRGRVPLGPQVYETRNGLAVQHAVSRSVRDSAALLDISQGAAEGDAYSAPGRERRYIDELTQPVGRLRIALMEQPILPVEVAPECQAAAQVAAKLCESLGHQVESTAPQLDVEPLFEAFGVSGSVLTLAKISAQEKILGRKVKPEEIEMINWRGMEEGRQVTGLQYSQARQTMHQASRSMARFMRDYDLILSPTMALVPPKLGVLSLRSSYESFMPPAMASTGFCSLYNMTGQPAMTVPLHWTARNIPIGVMFAGRFGAEASLFRLAAQLEKAAPWFDRLPPVG